MSLRRIRDLEEKEICLDPDHNPPDMIVLGPGVYEHECPKCGKKVIFTVGRYYAKGKTYKGKSGGRAVFTTRFPIDSNWEVTHEVKL